MRLTDLLNYPRVLHPLSVLLGMQGAAHYFTCEDRSCPKGLCGWQDHEPDDIEIEEKEA